MEVVIAGGHGQIALHLSTMLAARGDRVRGIIRNNAQSHALRTIGAEPVVLDLEQATVDELARIVHGADAVVFAAGAGPGSGSARKETVDYQAAVNVLEATKMAGVERYLVISAMRTDDPPAGDDVFSIYLRAKAGADREVMASDRAWTIVRPARLTNDPGTGRVWLDRHAEHGEIAREDVAAVLIAMLDDVRTAGHVVELTGGDTPIDEAVAALVT